MTEGEYEAKNNMGDASPPDLVNQTKSEAAQADYQATGDATEKLGRSRAGEK